MPPSILLRRVLTEVLAAALTPLMLVLLPLLPLTAVTVAEIDRLRARACGAPTSRLRPAHQSWPTWCRARVRTSGLWRTDLPIFLTALLLGVLSLLIVFFGFFGALALVTSPVLWAFGVAAQVGPFTPASFGQSLAAVPAGAALALVTTALLFGLSKVRDAALLGFSSQHDLDLQAQLKEVRTSRASLTEAFEQERRRIERDLHDGAQQDLVAVVLSLGLLESAASSGADKERIQALAQRSQDQAERALRRLRDTVRGIHPPELSDLGFVAAIRELASRSPLDVEVMAEDADDSSLSSPSAGAVYFAVSEALTNVAKHAGVDHVSLELHCAHDGVTARVIDTGPGGVELGKGTGTGLLGLRERMRSIGGDLKVISPPGNGTTVEISAPAEPRW